MNKKVVTVLGEIDPVGLGVELSERRRVEELSKFKFAGGGTVCDVTPRMLGRDPEALRRISLAAGLHVRGEHHRHPGARGLRRRNGARSARRRAG